MEQNQPLKIIKGGDNPGIWGVELLVIRYAAWLNPDFEIQVYNTFRDAVLTGMSLISKLNRLDMLIESEKKDISDCARKMNQWGAGGRKRLLNEARKKLKSEVQISLLETN